MLKLIERNARACGVYEVAIGVQAEEESSVRIDLVDDWQVVPWVGVNPNPAGKAYITRGL